MTALIEHINERTPELWAEVEAIRGEYLGKMRAAGDRAETAAGIGDMKEQSIHSTERERMSEAVSALSRILRIIEKFEV